MSKMASLQATMIISFGASMALGGGLGYYDFPSALREVLDRRQTEISKSGQMFVAGRVSFSDGMPILDAEAVKVLLNSSGERPMRVYEGGWFLQPSTLPSRATNHKARLDLRAFDYDPIYAEVPLKPREISYVEFEMKRTPERERCSISGHVLNEDDSPAEDVRVSLLFPGASLGYSSLTGHSEPAKLFMSGPAGEYKFDDISAGRYRLQTQKSDMAPDHYDFELEPGQQEVLNLFVSPNVIVELEFAYQPDGGRSFTGAGVRSGDLLWVRGSGGVDFSEGHIEGYDGDDLRDLELKQVEGIPHFDIFYHGRLRNGFYDAGEKSFGAVTEALTSGYRGNQVPCKEGHVYVVRTYEGHYAKFRVLSIR